MSNNPNWKRQLQDKINEHNRQHGSKPKGVSNKTMHERACSLFRSFTLLRRLGYQIDLNNLAGRHIQMLVDYWTGNARVADRCRQRSLAMLERPHSTPYIEQQLSFLRVYGDTWIGKPGMVHPLADYVDDPPPRRLHAHGQRFARFRARSTAHAISCGNPLVQQRLTFWPRRPVNCAIQRLNCRGSS